LFDVPTRSRTEQSGSVQRQAKENILSHARPTVRRRPRLTALTIIILIILIIRLFVVVFLGCLAGWLMHTASNSAPATAFAVVTVATASAKVAAQITDRSTFLM
jgi:cytochrome b561